MSIKVFGLRVPSEGKIKVADSYGTKRKEFEFEGHIAARELAAPVIFRYTKSSLEA